MNNPKSNSHHVVSRAMVVFIFWVDLALYIQAIYILAPLILVFKFKYHYFLVIIFLLLIFQHLNFLQNFFKPFLYS